MIPFIDNRHADTDETHRYRVKMLGSHRLKVTKSDELQGQKILRHSCSPAYTFYNKKGKFLSHLVRCKNSLLKRIPDFLEFHRLILLKEVKHYFDVRWIKSLKDKESQCCLSTIRILRDAMSRTRYILYFRKSSDRKSAFEEWPGKYTISISFFISEYILRLAFSFNIQRTKGTKGKNYNTREP